MANQSESEQYAFNAFANLPFYGSINSEFIELANVYDKKSIVDLGCGTGNITKLILKKLQLAKDSVIYAVDSSKSALVTAANEVENNPIVRFIHSEVQNLTESVREKADAMIYCNSIHYVPDKEKLLTEINNKLNKNGVLAFNSSFYEGSHPDDSLDFYKKWMFRSFRLLKKDHGLKPDKSAKVSSREQLSPEDYQSLLEKTGYKVEHIKAKSYQVPIDGFHYISEFKDWIEGVLPGVPLEIGKSTLQKALREIFEEMSLITVPRNWLSVRAVKA
jgi:trans-aconitate methyltransferase